jgi:hypothetical protein
MYLVNVELHFLHPILPQLAGVHLAEQVLSQVSVLRDVHGHEYLEVLQLKGVRVSFKSIFDNELQKYDN